MDLKLSRAQHAPVHKYIFDLLFGTVLHMLYCVLFPLYCTLNWSTPGMGQLYKCVLQILSWIGIGYTVGHQNCPYYNQSMSWKRFGLLFSQCSCLTLLRSFFFSFLGGVGLSLGDSATTGRHFIISSGRGTTSVGPDCIRQNKILDVGGDCLVHGLTNEGYF